MPVGNVLEPDLVASLYWTPPKSATSFVLTKEIASFLHTTGILMVDLMMKVALLILIVMIYKRVALTVFLEELIVPFKEK